MLGKDIGRPRAYAAEILRTHGLTPFRNILTPVLFQSIRPCTPRRSTVLISEVVFWLMATVALGDGAMAGAVVSFWATLRTSLPYLPSVPVTEEAFCLARKSLPVRFFRQLFEQVIARFDREMPDRYRWKGFRLLGIDGMEMKLPSSELLRKVYHPASNQRGVAKHPQARLVGLVGLWDGLCRGFRLVPCKYSEQRCARILIRSLGHQDLCLCDRNFVGLHTMGTIVRQGADFLMRLRAKRYHKLPRQATPSGRTDEWYVTLRMTKPLLAQYPELPPTLKVRILKYQIPGYSQGSPGSDDT